MLVRSLRAQAVRSVRSFRHKAAFSADLPADDIVSENNPWLPTLYQDTVHVRRGLRNVPLAANFRLSYEPLYEAPGAKYVAMMRRLTLSFAVLGVYGAKLFWELAQFDDALAGLTLAATWTPAAAVYYKTADYVTRVFRLYDKSAPQTLDNLVRGEQLVVEKLTATGGSTYNTLVSVAGNDALRLAPSSAWTPYRTWQDGDRGFYIADNVGGMKMDRLWGIVEHNSGVDNGRYVDLPAEATADPGHH